MKLTLILTIAAICSVHANVVSQTVTFSSKNGSVADIIATVRKQTGYVFFYHKNTVSNTKAVSVNARGLPLKDFLNLAFAGQPFNWSLENQTIILEPVAEKVQLVQKTVAAASAWAPVPVKVLDSSGKALADVSISVRASGKSGITNSEGMAIIDLTAGDVISVMLVGFGTEQLTVTAEMIKQGSVTVTLLAKQAALDDIIVVGYGTQRKSDVTGALTRISAATIQERPLPNLAQALQGKASGLNVSTNIKPGETPAIRIRGSRSYNASNEPLYVVDGVPIVAALGVTSFSINDLNPNDIASVEVLKDASATAIYGSRGANGVILVTTKKGAKGKVSMNFTSSVTFDSYKVLADRMDAGQYIDRLREALINGRRYHGSNPSDLNLPATRWYPDPRLDSANFIASGVTTNFSELLAATMKGYEWNEDGTVKTRATTAAEQALGWPSTIPVYNARNIPGFDWLDAATRTGVSQNHQIAISSGTENTRLYMSLGYNKQLGVQRDQDFERFNVNLNGDVTPTKWFSTGISMIASLAKQNFGLNDNSSNTGAKDLFGRALSQFPWASPTDGNGNLIPNAGGNLNLWNPLIDIDQSLNERRITSALSNLYAEVKLLPGLKYRVNFGAQVRNTRSGSWTGPSATAHLGAKANTASYERDENFSWVAENLLYYDKRFSANHVLGVTLLQSAQKSRRESSSIGIAGVVVPLSRWYDLGSNTQGNPGIGTGFTENTLRSYMGRVNYTFNNRYLLTASGRYDGASVLAPSHKWQFFPSFALAWKMQEEKFIEKIKWINELKPRIGYGVTGNSSVSPYTTTGPLGRNNYVFGSTPAVGYLPDGVENRELSWEKTAQLNLGIDFGVLDDNRITGSVEYYVQRTSDLLFSRGLPPVSGYISKLMNIGKSRNRGWEITINTQNIKTKDFSWSTELNWSTNKEEIIELINGKQDMLANRLFIGQPWEVFFQLQSDGIWGNSAKDLEEMTKFRTTGGLQFRPGTVKVVDQNGDYKIDAADYVIRGTPRPKWYGGITNTFRYKGISLSSFIYARVGQTYFGGYPGLFGRVEADRWSWDNMNGRWPVPVLGVTGITNAESAMQYNDGSFAVVRNISVIYEMPSKLISRAKLKSLQFNFQLMNPFIFGGDVVKMGLNPDDETNWTSQSQPDSFTTSPGGGMNSNAILPRSIVIGLRAGF